MPKSSAPRKKKNRNKAKVASVKAKTNKLKNQDQDALALSANTIKDLTIADAECRNMLAQTSRVSPYLLNKELMSHADLDKVNVQASILSKDVIRFKDKLDNIHARVPVYIDFNDMGALQDALSLGEEYLDWQEQYQACVVPVIEELNVLLSDAAAKLEASNSVAESAESETDQ